MKKFFLALVALAMVPAIYAAEDTPIQNVCDSLSLGGTPVIELVPAYIDESNWYGNPHTWAKDSSNSMRHESYETVTVSSGSDQTTKLPISIKAGCLEKRGQEVVYAKWNTSKTWSKVSEDDVATRIYTLRELTMEGHDATNTYNLLAFVPGTIPENLSFSSTQLLYSVTFEFAFEFWIASASYQHKFRNPDDPETTVRTTGSYVISSGNDSLRVVNGAVKTLKVPDTTKSIRIQTLKAVLVDSRKPLLPESSSSETPVVSSSSETPVVSSSSETPVESSSSETPTSSEVNSSSSHGLDESSSSEVGTSSSTEPETSSSAEPGTSSSGDVPASSSSGTEPASSSSEGSTRLVTAPAQGATARVVQIRTLDGSIVKNSATLAPGVYYMKYSDGKWHKTAVLPR
jgi:hypothetical protein